MKKLFLLGTMLLTFSGIGFAQKLTVATGVWKGVGDVCLYSTENGRTKLVSLSKPDSEGRFALAFMQEREGFYVIGDQGASRTNKFIFYLKPGDQLNVEIADDTFRLVGKNTRENQEMERWQNFIADLQHMSFYFSKYRSTYVDYFPVLESKMDEFNNYSLKYKGNTTFYEAFQWFKHYEFALTNLNLVMTPRSAHPQGEDFPAYYGTINVASMSGDQLMDYPYGMQLLTTVCNIYPLISGMSSADRNRLMASQSAMIDFYLPQIEGEKVKGEYVISRLGGFKSYYELKDFEEKYSAYLVTESQKNSLKAALDKASREAGSPATDFTAEDINGNKVSLSDFKGKAAVYIDFWATWCGPCLAQIPHLKKLEAEYHGNDNIVFMSLSSDQVKDHEKWKTMVREQELGGVQLFAGEKAREILGAYNVTGIPRFVLVGKSGNIISSDAPRPSSPDQIKRLIEEAMKR